MSIINDKEMLEEIIRDLVEHREYTEEDAKAWAKEHGCCIVDAMWDEYSHYIESNAEYKGED